LLNGEWKHVSVLKKNIIANLAGSFWQSLLGLAAIPFYIKFLGIESWGLVGLLNSLQVVFSVFDMGISSTVNREMARLSVHPGKKQEMCNLVHTAGILYWGIALTVGGLAVFLAVFMSHHWINPEGSLPRTTIEQAMLIMGVLIALRMPIGLYSGALMGLQKQVLLNGINMLVSMFGAVSSILVIWLVFPTVQAFLLWQIVIIVITILLQAYFVRREFADQRGRSQFQIHLFKGIWRFAAGISGISILGIILSQLDKIILSKMLPLDMFGYYMLAVTVAMSLTRFFTPMFNSMYPKFTQLASIDDQDGLIQLYHKSCQFMSVLIMPVAVIIALFSYEIILLWTQNPTTAKNTHLLVSILISGSAINGLMNLPYAMQLAFGWTRLPLFENIIAVILLVPLIVYLTMRYGAIGAAVAWLVLNVGFILFVIPIMHRRLLRTEKWQWYCQDISLPLVTCLLVAGIGRIFVNEPMSQFMMLLSLIIISVSTLVVVALTTSVTRSWLFVQLFKIKSLYGN